MMRLKLVAAVAFLLAVAVPAQANAAIFRGTVIATQPQRGTLVLAGKAGVGLTVHASRVGLGKRVVVRGTRLHDGTIRATRLSVLSSTRHALIRGVVVRRLARSTLVATGRSVITIRHGVARNSARVSDHGRLGAGTIAEFRIRIDDDDLFEDEATIVGQAGDVKIEGAIVSLSPLVVSVEGLPITIAVPSGMALPPGLAAGQRIELVVRVTAPNVFTLVAIDAKENENEDNQEVEVKGLVVSSSPTSIAVASHGAVFTFAAPSGVTLSILPVGKFVEARGVTINGVLTLTRLKVEDDDHHGHGG